MKFIVFLILFISINAHGLQCVDLINKLDVLSILDSDPEKAADQLRALMESTYDIPKFEFMTAKYDVYKPLAGVELSEADVRKVMARIAEVDSFYSLDLRAQKKGQTALESIPFESLSAMEKTALALIYFHSDRKIGAYRALNILKDLGTVHALWYGAEIHYKLGEFSRSLESLDRIRIFEEGTVSSKTEEAYSVVMVKMSGGSFSDTAQNSGFDNTQWGHFERGSTLH